MTYLLRWLPWLRALVESRDYYKAEAARWESSFHAASRRADGADARVEDLKKMVDYLSRSTNGRNVFTRVDPAEIPVPSDATLPQRPRQARDVVREMTQKTMTALYKASAEQPS